MAGTSLRTALGQMNRLFSDGAVGGLSDAQLLERFADRRDESAFATLLERHGPMVLAVCRGVLRDTVEADDAFQATFLVLVRKAGSLWVGDSLGGWLHRVASRVALQLSVEATRRRARQGGSAVDLAVDRSGPDPLDELRPLLHAEVARLPEKYRLPLVFCYLEGATQPQAAARLRCSEATLRRRLAGARDLLRARLTRRGIAPAAAAIAGLSAESARAVPCPLAAATLRSVSAYLAGGAIDVSVTSLAAGVLRGMGMARIRAAAIALGMLGMTAVLAAGVVARDEREPKPGEPRSTPAPPAAPGPAAKEAPGESRPLVYRGAVLDPDGKPAAGARLYLDGNCSAKVLSEQRASSGPDGRFRFAVPRSEFDPAYDDEPWSSVGVVALAPGYGMGIARDSRAGQSPTLRLVEDLPIDGRVVDLQGRPVAGARIRPITIRGTERGDLTPLLLPHTDPAAAGKVRVVDDFAATIMGRVPDAVTGADGRFRLAGLGRERLVLAVIEGPAIATELLHIMTRRAPSIAATEGPRRKYTILGAEFDYIAAPSHPIEGVVRDRDTAEPLGGVEIQGNHPYGFVNYVKAVTNRAGRFRLLGLPAGREARLSAVPPPDEPYLRASRKVDNALGSRATEVSIVMERGVWIEGRVTDKATGRPVRGQVSYFLFNDNPQAAVFREFNADHQHELRYTGPDGSYRLIGLPGPGLVAFKATDDRYCRALIADGTRSPGKDKYYSTQPSLCLPINFHALAEVSPADGARGAHRDFQVDPGRSVKVAFTDPDGQPLAGAEVLNRAGRSHELEEVPASTFEVIRLLKDEERTLTILHDGRKLSAGLTVRGGEPGPVTVRLQPWGVLTGRLVDSQGEPLAGVHVGGVDRPRFDPVSGGTSGTVPVDEQGRFRAEGLVAGRKYALYFGRGSYHLGRLGDDLVLKPGEERDLGTIEAREGR